MPHRIQRKWTRVKFIPRINRGDNMVTVFCDELGLAASAATEHEAFDRLSQTIQSFGRALQRKDQRLWERALRESEINWESVAVDAKPGELVVDI